MKKLGILSLFVVISLVGASPSLVLAGGTQDYNGCKLTTDDPCLRQGSCSIQGTSWYQDVTAFRSEKFDTQGWPGVCDMVHVSLIQGRCEPLDSQTEVTAHLGDLSSAFVPELVGTLACGGEVPDPNAEICNDGIDNDGDNKIDCADKKDCNKDSFCRL